LAAPRMPRNQQYHDRVNRVLDCIAEHGPRWKPDSLRSARLSAQDHLRQEALESAIPVRGRFYGRWVQSRLISFKSHRLRGRNLEKKIYGLSRGQAVDSFSAVRAQLQYKTF
jgi:hypothetical protein